LSTVIGQDDITNNTRIELSHKRMIPYVGKNALIDMDDK
jgi:hypothetical protein